MTSPLTNWSQADYLLFNTQQVFDIKLAAEPGTKNFITISQQVMQRLLDGATKGLLLRLFGSINARFILLMTRRGGPTLYSRSDTPDMALISLWMHQNP